MKTIIQCDDSEHNASHLNLREIERDIQRRGGEMDVAGMPVAQQDGKDAMRMQMALMVGAWQSEIRLKLDGVMQQIERIGEPDEHWEILRRQVETARPEIAQYMTASVSALTKVESKILLLMGMNIPQQKIAEILNLTLQSVSDHREKIHGKLSLAGDIQLDESFGVALR